MRALIAMLAAGTLMACSTTPAPEPTPAAPVATPQPGADGKITIPAGSDAALPAPKAGPVTLALTAADAGKSFTMKKGERVSVSLVGVPTAGYIWSAPTPPAFLKISGETSGPTSANQLKPGFTGGNHWEVTVFEATAAGKGELKFEQRRPWETKEPPSDTWSATIEVK